VRDPAGELTDRLHLLTLGDLHLERALLGGVDGVGHRRLALALGLLDRAEIDPAAPLAAAGEDDVDRIDLALASERRFERAAKRMPALGLDQRFEPHLIRLRTYVAEQAHEGGVDGADEALRIDGGDRDGR